MYYYNLVLLEALRSFDQFYTYRTQTPLPIGARVLVPFGVKDEPQEAVVFSEADALENAKSIIQRLQVPPLSEVLINSLSWAEDYYVAPIGALAKQALPKAVRFEATLHYEKIAENLSREDEKAIEKGELGAKQLQALVDQGQIARVYSAHRKGLPRVRRLRLYDREALLKLQSELSQRQQILHRTIEQLLSYPMIPVAKNVTPKHRDILLAHGVELIQVVPEPTPSPAEQALPPLTPEQLAIADILASGTHLIYGPPAAGKSLIGYHRIKQCLAQSQQVLVLVSERLLAEQTAEQLRNYFRAPVAVIHGQQSDGQLREQYHFIAEGKYSIVVGTRNALLAPFQQLGLIVIDDFHADSFYSDEPPVDFRRLAMHYAKGLDIPLLLISSTPDIMYLADPAIAKHYLEQSFYPGQRSYKLIDMQAQLSSDPSGLLSPVLFEALKHKSLLFLNRIGYAGLIRCQDCGQALNCPECDIPMLYHRSQRRLDCRNCGRSQPMPQQCPHCQSDHFELIGGGLERLEAWLQQQLPDRVVRRFDSQSLRKKRSLKQVPVWLKHSDILLATQILTKGHDIPGLEVVGLLAPDMLLNTPEFRAREKCFQSLIQAAGRVGRGEPGQVYIQSYMPRHDVYQYALQEDIVGFYRREYQLRNFHGLPPCRHLIKLIVSDQRVSAVEDFAERLGQYLESHFEYEIKGPYIPIHEKVGAYYRRMLLISSEDEMDDLKNFLRRARPRRSIRMQVMVDPLTTLY